MRIQNKIVLKKGILLLFLCISIMFKIDAQISKLERANKYYHQKKYAKSIPLYEKSLEGKPSNSLRLKLANAYSKINNHKKANEYYELLIHAKRIRPQVYLKYASSLIAVGNYDKADEMLALYKDVTEEVPSESLALVLATNIDTKIAPYFNIDSIQYLPFNSKYDENSPIFFNNEIVFSSDRPSGLFKLKSGKTGHGLVQIYTTNKSKINKFPSLNKSYLNTANASFDSTETQVYYTQNSVKSTQSDVYSMQILSAHLEDGHWIKDGVLPFCRNGQNYMHPAISPDGKRLYFVSDKSDAIGGTDIFVVYKTKEGWSDPENLGPNINTEMNEGFPFVDIHNNLYFCSKGHGGLGGFDVFISKTLDLKSFNEPINLGAPINSYADDISFTLSQDRKKGLFATSRNDGDDDIFMVNILDKD